MKKSLLFLFALCLLTLWSYGQKRPDWVAQRPINTMYYTGIGMASKTEKDYIQRAKQNALSDLVSEIKVEVSSNSLLQTLENNGDVKSKFEETIRLGARESIENFQLIESWQDDAEYWVYYQLSKFDYEEYVARRREQAIKKGFDFWYKGQALLQQGDLMVALDLFLKGLDVIQPVINEDLTCSYEEKTMDVGQALYTSVKGIFTGVVIAPSTEMLEGKAFQGIEQPVDIQVTKEGIPLRNLNLKFEFVSGSGQLSQKTLTDNDGTVKMYVLNVTSKAPKQEIDVTIDEKPFGQFKNGIYAGLVKNVITNAPKGVVYVNIGQSSISAYIKVKADSDPTILRAVQNILTNNYFNIVGNPAVANVSVLLNSSFRKGEKVEGDMYNLIAYYAGAGVKIINNSTNAVLLDYALDDIKVILSETTSLTSAKSAAIRELLKRLNRELPRLIKELNITVGEVGNVPDWLNDEPQVKPDTKPEEQPEEKPVKPKPVVVVTPPANEPVQGEFMPNLFIRYKGMRQMTDRTILEFVVINKTGEDHHITLYSSDQIIINEKGEEVRVAGLKLGANENGYYVSSTIIPEVNTQLIVTTKKLKEVKMIEFKNREGMVKLRNLK